MKGQLEQTIALVLAAHGDRGGDAPNERLFAHAAVLSERHDFACVATGLLNGEPALEEALAQADACGANQIVIYPVFMSAGYFVKTVLADRVAAAALKTPAGIMQPLGLDKRLALLMLENALRSSKSANLDPAGARLLIVGHGSRDGTENAEATRRAARLLSPHSPFARVETAFIEEAPFVADALGNYDGTSVVAGFLTGEGLHAGEDVPEIIRESGARALYTGPIGGHPRVPELIASSIHDALSNREEGGDENENENKDEAEKAAVSAQAHAEPAAGPAVRAGVGPDAAAAATGVRQEPHEKPRRAGRRGGPGRFLMKAAAALVLIAALVIGVVPFLVPEDVVRDRVASVVKQQTGRDLAVRGGTSFSVFPNVGVELEDVSISNPPGMAKGDVLRMDSLNLNLKLLPLLTRRVEVDRFVLVRPVFNLMVDSQGRRNWDLNKTAALERPYGTDVALHASTVKSSAALAQAGGGGTGVQDISLGTVKITDGTLNYADERDGTRRRVQAINITLVQPQLADPLDAEGDLVWNGEKLSFDGRVNRVSALLRDEPTEAKMSLSSRHGQGSFDGQVSLAPSFSANGAVNAETKSVRALAGWLGDPLPPGGGLGPLSIVGNLGIQGETIAFTKAKLGIDGMAGEGRVSVRLKGVRPHITASLALDKLDLNPYLEGTSAVAPSPAAPAQPGTQDEPASAPEQGDSLTDFIEKLNKGGSAPAQPQVRAWSQHAMDFNELRAADADVKITANAIHFRKVRTGRSDITAAVKSGVLTADLTRFELYSGTGSGRVTLNGARTTPGISALFNLSNISALPLLRDFADFNWVSGRANMALSVSGNGRSQSEIMHSLQGQGSFAFGDGAIEGFNIPAMVRGLKQGKFDGWKRNEREKTDFSQLTASFVINQGVANNKDLNLVGPLVRMTGEGDIDLGREQIDYSALPRLVASLEGQGAQIEQGRGIAVPIKIVGSWERPKLTVDLERLMNDPELTQNAIDEVGRALENVKNKDDLNKVLEGLFGGGNQQSPNGGQQGEGGQVKPGDLLKRFLQ